ncbi:MAG: TIGR00725 family protein [Cyanobacteria bacterium CRU_2_1]|nr:TIGR00725 family protein [Cyanobacteria bacterium RU_5_0]NJR60829.1 TIGR00725 family protein [Cyanobacteria bacterium CRU_2_1]
MMRKPIAGVMGPGKTATTSDLELAFELGKQIAEQDWILLTGGRNEGVMDAANRGAKQANGLTVGILPSSDDDEVSSAVDIPILTGMGSARNNINVLTSHIIFACGMGSGTASEVALALKANKPVILLNTNATSQTFFKALGADRVFVAANATEAVAIAKTVLEIR